AMRQMGAVDLSEGELQYLHAWNANRLAQLDHFGRDESEVLGDERQIAERVAHRVEERLAGTGHPAAVNRSRLGSRDLPVGSEAAEVIDAQYVGEAERGAESRHPPAITRLAQDVPPVERIAPPLPRLAEVVGRNAGDDG